MRTKVVGILMIVCSLALSSKGQKRYTPLKIGDKVPDEIVLKTMFNYPGGKAKLSDFRGKLLILDFWSIGCPPCIGGFPKMEKLQKEFDGKIQILLVNSINSLETCGGQGFPAKSPITNIQKTKLPFVFQSVTQKENVKYVYGKEDIGILSSLFEHYGEPYHVWIDQKGIVIALTKAENTNEQTIRTFLGKKAINLVEWNSPTAFHYETDATFLKPPNELVLSKLAYSSVITKNLFTKHGIGGGPIITDTVTNTFLGFRITNETPIRLFKSAYDFDLISGLGANGGVILEAKNIEYFIPPTNPDDLVKWQEDNMYCYEIMLPPHRITKSMDSSMVYMKKLMRQDLERFFGVKGVIEKRKVKCFVFTRTNSNIDLKSAGGKTIVERSPNEIKISNSYFFGIVAFFQNAMNLIMPGTTAADETGLNNIKIDMQIKANIGDIAAVKKELERYGIAIREEEREFEMLVLKSE